jgi:uncharacterized protein (UPF0335 family)
MSAHSTTPGIGHNGSAVDAAHLTAFIERVETINEQIKEGQEARKEVFSEAKSFGYDLPAMRALIKLRAMDPDERHAAEDMLDLYKSATGLG